VKGEISDQMADGYQCDLFPWGDVLSGEPSGTTMRNKRKVLVAEPMSKTGGRELPLLLQRPSSRSGFYLRIIEFLLQKRAPGAKLPRDMYFLFTKSTIRELTQFIIKHADLRTDFLTRWPTAYPDRASRARHITRRDADRQTATNA
jgi:hypothetical protein